MQAQLPHRNKEEESYSRAYLVLKPSCQYLELRLRAQTHNPRLGPKNKD